MPLSSTLFFSSFLVRVRLVVCVVCTNTHLKYSIVCGGNSRHVEDIYTRTTSRTNEEEKKKTNVCSLLVIVFHYTVETFTHYVYTYRAQPPYIVIQNTMNTIMEAKEVAEEKKKNAITSQHHIYFPYIRAKYT